LSKVIDGRPFDDGHRRAERLSDALCKLEML
jgi:hypothetical protein